MEHKSHVVSGSTKKSALGGIEFVVRCCDSYEKSVHIQQPGKFTQAELQRIRSQHLADVALEHANHEAALAFLSGSEQDCGCP